MPWFWYPNRQKAAIQESIFLLVITFWNLCCLELTRTLVQRPRPLVFNSPMTEGANIHQYTSFYSGHTSFVALATLGLFFVARRRFAGHPLRLRIAIGFFAFYLSMSLLVGMLRIYGGRHFPTDVLGGFFIGSLIAIFANYLAPQKPTHLKSGDLNQSLAQ
jgi:membrane-associated phospholipid phosphatase